MHDTAFRIGSLAMETYVDLRDAAVLEIGAQSVNGSLRVNALPTTQYIGIDIEEGEGVDIVIRPGEDWPVEDGHFDLVMATSVFEHDSSFWRTFLQMCRKSKPGGHIYISAPSNGKVHRYPQDYWRFYPDAGLALEALATSEGVEVKLVESFVAEREGDEWNDFCAIFRREPSSEPLPTSFIWERVACTNALTWQSPEVINARESTEDQVLFRREAESVQRLLRKSESDQTVWEAERHALVRQAAEARVELEKTAILLEDVRTEAARLTVARDEVDGKLAALNLEFQASEHRIADLEGNLRQQTDEISHARAEVEAERAAKEALATELQGRTAALDQVTAARDEANRKLVELDREIQRRDHRIADLESNLRQRQEEISQAWNQVEAERSAKDALAAQLKDRELEVQELVGKLRDADEWVYKLAGERREAEQLSAKLNSELLRERALRSADQAEVDNIVEQFHQIRKARKTDKALLEKGHRKVAQILGELREREVDLAAKQADIDKMASQLASAEDELGRAREEMSSLARKVRDEELVGLQKGRHLDWLRRVEDVSQHSIRRWRAFMPPAWRRRLQLRALREEELFDAAAYLERYPDVAEKGIDPLLHYVLYGIGEGRQADITPAA